MAGVGSVVDLVVLVIRTGALRSCLNSNKLVHQPPMGPKIRKNCRDLIIQMQMPFGNAPIIRPTWWKYARQLKYCNEEILGSIRNRGSRWIVWPIRLIKCRIYCSASTSLLPQVVGKGRIFLCIENVVIHSATRWGEVTAEEVPTLQFDVDKKW